jgi:hypothetical protein
LATRGTGVENTTGTLQCTIKVVMLVLGKTIIYPQLLLASTKMLISQMIDMLLPILSQ